MSHNWKKYKIKEISASIAMGPFGSNIKRENFVDKGVPVIRGGNLNNFRYVSGEFVYLKDEKANSLKNSIAFPEEIVFTHRGTIGQVGIIPKNKYEKYVVSQSQLRLALKKDIVDPYFLFYFFKSSIGQIKWLQNSSQVGVPAIASPTSSLKEIELDLPSLSEQHAIAEILSSLDDKIELNLQTNKTLEEMANAYLLNIIQSNNKIQIKLGDLITVQNGYAFKGSAFVSNGNQGIIKIKNINNGIVDIHTTDFVTHSDISQLDEKFKLQSRNVLIAMTGAEIGKIGIIENNKKNLWLNQRVGLLVPKFPSADKLAYLFVNSNVFQDFIKNKATGSAQPNISGSEIESLEIEATEITYLKQATEFIEPLFEQITLNLSENYLLKQTRDYLLPKLISGEIRVKDVQLPNMKEGIKLDGIPDISALA